MPAYHSCRPPRNERRFTSPAVDQLIEQTTAELGQDSELAWLFANCFPNTLDTTIFFNDDDRPDTFVITGDIPAMWLRDSAAQVWPYLPLASDDPLLARMIQGVINRQSDCICLDPYANAFNRDTTAKPYHDDQTHMQPGVWERKWEIDSLCYAIRLSYGYWQATGDTTPFDQTWCRAMQLVVHTFQQQQRIDNLGPYQFQRRTPVPTDTLMAHGFGSPVKPCGLIVSSFRPSDDACIWQFLVPANMFAVVSLRQLAEMSEAILHDQDFAQRCRRLADQVAAALQTVALGPGPHGSDISTDTWCYECDGFGNRNFMDDANVPSLLSLPYLGWCSSDDSTYQATRRWVLSETNPYFRRGRDGEGVSGPHRTRDEIWPMAIIMRALTSTDPAEQQSCLATLINTHAGTGFMHETFHADDCTQFSRPWFAWANTLFGELVLRMLKDGVIDPS